ncbi:MAG TPA: hypothetical protein DCO79_08045 [Spirochaeta sp.]|nr:hypothetical protein [Spirochaeta sp.]
MNKTLVIMAAGMGSRYGGLKQLDSVGPSNETIIDYSVYDAVRAGFTKAVFVIRKEIAEAFKESVGSKFSERIDVKYVYQELSFIPDGSSLPQNRTKPWGTGHAMLSSASEISEPFLIINADDFYGADAFKKAAKYLDGMNPDITDAALVGFLLKNTLSGHGSVARGICDANDCGILTGVEEILGIKKIESGRITAENREGLRDDDIVSMNMWAFSPRVLDFATSYFREFLAEHGNKLKSEFFIPIIVNRLIREENLSVRLLETTSVWHGVTYREDKPEVEMGIKGYIDDGLYPENLWGKE